MHMHVVIKIILSDEAMKIILSNGTINIIMQNECDIRIMV